MKHFNRGFLALIVIGWTLLTPEVCIAENEDARSPLDKDGDGVVSKSEWDNAKHKPKALFTDIDVNGNGYLTQQELRTYFRNIRRTRARQNFSQ